jgi:hypothetical protein
LAYFIHIVDDAIYDLTLEWFEHDRAVPGDELGLAAPAQDHTFPDVEDGNYGDDVPELA